MVVTITPTWHSEHSKGNTNWHSQPAHMLPLQRASVAGVGAVTGTTSHFSVSSHFYPIFALSTLLVANRPRLRHAHVRSR
eukprot:scaffold1860_cov83-Skeletonema_dohrnii-CCMP3373.AAC.2